VTPTAPMDPRDIRSSSQPRGVTGVHSSRQQVSFQEGSNRQ
jgi:hypothetical protein